MANTTARTKSNARSRSSASGTRSRSSSNRSQKNSSRARPANAGSSRRSQADVRKTVSAVASKAKTPLVAGGAALVGLAGGVAISRNGSGKKLLGMRMPQIGGGDSTKKAMEGAAKAFGTAAKEIGKAGYQAGQLTSEVRRVRERVSDE
jgi:hypothetical protein